MKLKRIFFITMYLAFSGILISQEIHQKDHQELRELMTKVVTAVNQKKIDELKPVLAREFVITMVDQTVITSFDGIKNFFNQYFGEKNALLKDLQIEPKAEVLTKFFSPEAGYTYGTSVDTYTLAAGKKVQMNSKWTATVIKEQGSWKLLNLHIGVSVIDNPLMKFGQSQKYLYGFIGFLVGAILIFFAGKLRNR